MSLGIIGGTGALDLFDIVEDRAMETPYGNPSSKPARVKLQGQDAWFLARHGRPHRIPPHRINYRANIDTLKRLGVTRVVAIYAVGAIDPKLEPGSMVVPDQIIDYTWGRAHTFSDDDLSEPLHIEFGAPFSASMRSDLLAACDKVDVKVHDGGCYAATQGPRLETAAEIRKLAGDGCTIVGMTGMPEASLAREAGLEFASICIAANMAAGLEAEPISIDEIHQVLARSMEQTRRIFEEVCD